jgi:outer membrane immunogenic protein
MFDGSDFAGSNIKGSNIVLPAEVFTTKVQWFGTLTARVGYAVQPQTLVYVKGGAAWLRNDYTDNCPTCPFFGNGSATRSGWTIGGGAEYKFDPNWSVFLEYDYVGLGNHLTTLTYTGAGFCCAYTYNFNHNFQAVLVGINYRFGDGRAVARY